MYTAVFALELAEYFNVTSTFQPDCTFNVCRQPAGKVVIISIINATWSVITIRDESYSRSDTFGHYSGTFYNYNNCSNECFSLSSGILAHFTVTSVHMHFLLKFSVTILVYFTIFSCSNVILLTFQYYSGYFTIIIDFFLPDTILATFCLILY